MNSTKDVLIAARKLVETEEKWWRGGRGQRDAHCPITAIGVACDGREPIRSRVNKVFAGAAFLDVTWYSSSIITWNDAPERTHADILAAFDKAIAECDQ